MRAGEPGRDPGTFPTAAINEANVTTVPPAHEQWATMRTAGRCSGGQPQICLWGDEASARENCDPDERVCRVRIEVLEVR